MKTAMTLAALLCGVAPLAAQSEPYGQPYRQSSEQKKAARDQLVNRLGPSAAVFVRKHGDTGIAALQRCSGESGKRLIALDGSGALDRLPAARLLALVALHGDPLADWLSVNHAALVDEAACAAFCQSPMDFVYDLKDLKTEADAVRQGKPGAAPTPPNAPGANPNWLLPGLLIVAGLVAAVFAGRAWGKRGA